MRSSFAICLILAAALLAPTFSSAQESKDDERAEKEKPAHEKKPADEEKPVQEIVIKATRPIARDRTSDDAEVEGQQLRDSPRASTLEALAQLSAGVYVPGRGAMHGVANGATGGITIRGLGGSPNSQILVVEDGAPDFMGIFGHPIPDAYVPFLIDEALVVKGGDSVLYGTNALGGAVVLRSRWRDDPGFEILNDVEVGAHSTLREAVSLLARKGDLDLAAAFCALSTDGHRDGAGGKEMVGQAAARYHFGPDLMVSLRDKVVHLAGSDPGPASHPFSDHWYDVWRNNSTLELEWTGRPLRLSATGFYNLGVHRLYDGFLSYDYVAGAIVEGNARLHRTVDLLLGLSAQRVDGRVDNRVSGERESVHPLGDLSAYGQLTLRPVAPLTIVAGARALYSITYGPVLLYKGGVRWRFYPGLYARTRIARNFRQPTIRELYLPFPTANPDLRPELALNWDFGLGAELEHFEISCTGYRTQADDMIHYFGAWPTAEVINIDHITIWGVEGRVGARRLGPVSVSVGADWRDVGRYTRQNPAAKLDFALEAEGSFGDHFFAGSLTGEWVHGLYMSNYGFDPIADVFFMDLVLRYRYALRDRSLSFEPYLIARNLLDRRFAYVEGYPMPGFNLLAGLRVGI